MNNKGFTLIEIIATVIILGLILVIAMPKITGVIDGSKKAAFKISANKILEEANKQYYKENVEVAKSYTITGGSFVGNSLNVTGDMPLAGNIYVDEDGKISLAVNNDKWCALKSINDEEIQLTPYEGECKITTPVACFTYTKNITEVTITDYDDLCEKDVIIPSKIDGLPVKIIGDFAFMSNQITSVLIPSSVTLIKGFAFMNNQLTSVIIPSGVTVIQGGAFYSNRLTSIELPNSVIEVGNQTFEYNQLASVTLSSNMTWLGQSAFKDNIIAEIEIPRTLSFIHSWAFANNKLTSITIPDEINAIYDYAFMSNQLTNIALPNSAISIGRGAFNDNQLSDSDAIIYERNQDGSENTSIIVSYGGARRDDVIIPNGVATIGYGAFSYNSLTSITIPNSVSSIGENAFQSNQLTSVTIPNNITTIGGSTFSHNDLRNIVIPDSVTTIGGGSFYNNFNLQSLTLSNNLISIGAWTFYSCDNLQTVIIPNGVTSIGSMAFSDTLLQITVPANLNITPGGYGVTQFGEEFYESYVIDNGRTAGTYVRQYYWAPFTKQP